jgi:retinol dehydrogenase 12
MQDKTVVITGASSGIGLATARELARKGALVVMVCRDAARAEAARQDVAAVATGPQPVVFLADLLSQGEIRSLAAAIGKSHARIDVLINNAGAVFTRRELTVDGIEKICRQSPGAVPDDESSPRKYSRRTARPRRHGNFGKP